MSGRRAASREVGHCTSYSAKGRFVMSFRAQLQTQTIPHDNAVRKKATDTVVCRSHVGVSPQGSSIAQYLYDTWFGVVALTSVGALDMGGASTQITFVPGISASDHRATKFTW